MLFVPCKFVECRCDYLANGFCTYNKNTETLLSQIAVPKPPEKIKHAWHPMALRYSARFCNGYGETTVSWLISYMRMVGERLYWGGRDNDK
jgi:hypothetical protein